MLLECKCDASFCVDTNEGQLSAIIKEKGTKNYYLREKTGISCLSSDQAEYFALYRLIKRVLDLQYYNIIPEGIEIRLYSDNKAVVDTIAYRQSIRALYKNIVEDIRKSYSILISSNPGSKLLWVKRTKNKEAHRYLYNKRHAGRKLIEIVPYQLTYEDCVWHI